MVGRIQTNQIRELLEELSSRQLNAGGNAQNNNTDVSVQVNYASLIDQAMKAPPQDHDVVAAARKLLLSDELISYENCREAAENIVDFGI
ncbi:MAG: hypothetical protein GWN67_19830 [Phycisphaerae bacterium]|nr:hypothetical protein [Phycisphaerae bacterium]NIU58545.1 hypothetical protein [Phycisphaerae bacterium]